MMTLYQFESCPDCKPVREKLCELLITYVTVNVPRDRSLRQAVIEVSGQPSVPVLVDGDTVLDDEEKILHHLQQKYGTATV